MTHLCIGIDHDDALKANQERRKEKALILARQSIVWTVEDLQWMEN